MRIRISLLAAAALIGVAALAPQPAEAGVAPWCAVQESTPYGDNWDCSYWTLQQCLPQVIAGDRGFCNQNPAWRGPWPPGQQRAQRRSRRY